MDVPRPARHSDCFATLPAQQKRQFQVSDRTHIYFAPADADTYGSHQRIGKSGEQAITGRYPALEFYL